MNGPYVLDWLNLVARWAHLIAGVSWIGASFYFVWLDDSLTPPEKPEDARRGMFGELWAVHGGGFYHNQKYLTGPRGEPLTESLHWFKWEAYSTWITGMAMLAIVYWAGASTYTIDKSVYDLTPAAAITISIASLVIGWLVYDGLCRLLGARSVILWTAISAFLLFVDWALFHVFGGRAASHVPNASEPGRAPSGGDGHGEPADHRPKTPAREAIRGAPIRIRTGTIIRPMGTTISVLACAAATRAWTSRSL